VSPIAVGDQPFPLGLDLLGAQVHLIAARLVALHLALELGDALRVGFQPALTALEFLGALATS